MISKLPVVREDWDDWYQHLLHSITRELEELREIKRTQVEYYYQGHVSSETLWRHNFRGFRRLFFVSCFLFLVSCFLFFVSHTHFLLGIHCSLDSLFWLTCFRGKGERNCTVKGKAYIQHVGDGKTDWCQLPNLTNDSHTWSESDATWRWGPAFQRYNHRRSSIDTRLCNGAKDALHEGRKTVAKIPAAVHRPTSVQHQANQHEDHLLGFQSSVLSLADLFILARA